MFSEVRGTEFPGSDTTVLVTLVLETEFRTFMGLVTQPALQSVTLKGSQTHRISGPSNLGSSSGIRMYTQRYLHIHTQKVSNFVSYTLEHGLLASH